jgi:hypothetical protein
MSPGPGRDHRCLALCHGRQDVKFASGKSTATNSTPQVRHEGYVEGEPIQFGDDQGGAMEAAL